MSGRRANRTEVRKGIDLLNYLASRDTADSVDSDMSRTWDSAVQMAIADTTRKARDFIVEQLNKKDWNRVGQTSSSGHEAPARRTGSLADSVKYQMGSSRIVLVTENILSRRMSYSKRTGQGFRRKLGTRETAKVERYDTNVRRVFIDSTNDRSRGQRLGLYSVYLQTGWVLGGRSGKPKMLPKGQRGDTPKRQRKDKIGQPGRVQPSRLVLILPISLGYAPFLVQYYRQRLKKYLPEHMHKLVSRTKLHIRYVRPFSQ